MTPVEAIAAVVGVALVGAWLCGTLVLLTLSMDWLFMDDDRRSLTYLAAAVLSFVGMVAVVVYASEGAFL